MKLEAIELPFQQIKDLDVQNHTIRLGNEIVNLDQQSCIKKVLKVTKFKNKYDGQIISKVRVLGNITTQYQHQGLLDFHYETKGLPITEQIKQYTEQNINEQEDQKPFQYYSEQMVPNQFLRAYNKIPHKINVFKRVKKTINIIINQQIYFENGIVPQQKQETGGKLFQTLEQMFEKRQIWLKNSIMKFIRDQDIEFTLTELKKELRKLTYSFKDGPWKNTYIKLGYDPRITKTALKYQVLDIVTRDRRDLEFKKCTKSTQKTLETYDPTFQQMPQHFRHMYQLCDIQNQNFILAYKQVQQNPTDHCNKKYGWIQQSDLRQLFKILKQQIKIN